MGDPANPAEPSNLPEEIVNVLGDELARAIPHAGEDLRVLAARIATNAAGAAASGRHDLLEECRAQAQALAEAANMRLTEFEWSAFSAIVGAVLRGVAVGIASVPPTSNPDNVA